MFNEHIRFGAEGMSRLEMVECVKACLQIASDLENSSEAIEEAWEKLDYWSQILELIPAPEYLLDN